MHKTKVVSQQSHVQASCGAWRGREAADPVDYEHPYPSMAMRSALVTRTTVRCACCTSTSTAILPPWRKRICATTCFTSSSTSTGSQRRSARRWPAQNSSLSSCSSAPLWRVSKDHDFLPAVLTRQQVHDLLGSVRLRRYRTPIKLIYCCGLRLGECLSLTIHDILGEERKLVIRNSKGHQDHVIPLPAPMLEDLRKYWSFHRHPRWLFPNVGRGDQTPQALAERMRSAKTPMPDSSLQRLIIVARKQLNFPAASIHSLRHSFATICWRPAHICTRSKSCLDINRSIPR